jgi:ferritin-like metal-binding protein YciE
MSEEQIRESLYQALQTEMGGVEVYRTALRCVENAELQEEWEEYLEQTEKHVEILREVFSTLGLDLDAETPGRKVVRHIGESLAKATSVDISDGRARHRARPFLGRGRSAAEMIHDH